MPAILLDVSGQIDLFIRTGDMARQIFKNEETLKWNVL